MIKQITSLTTAFAMIVTLSLSPALADGGKGGGKGGAKEDPVRPPKIIDMVPKDGSLIINKGGKVCRIMKDGKCVDTVPILGGGNGEGDTGDEKLEKCAEKAGIPCTRAKKD